MCAAKPDPSLFRQTAAELAVATSELLHAGDYRTTDVLGVESIDAVARQSSLFLNKQLLHERRVDHLLYSTIPLK